MTQKPTIKIEKQTKIRLGRLKEHERETYNQVIKKILYILNRSRKDPVSANRILQNIDKNIRRKKGYSEEKIKSSEEENEKNKTKENFVS